MDTVLLSERQRARSRRKIKALAVTRPVRCPLPDCQAQVGETCWDDDLPIAELHPERAALIPVAVVPGGVGTPERADDLRTTTRRGSFNPTNLP